MLMLVRWLLTERSSTVFLGMNDVVRSPSSAFLFIPRRNRHQTPQLQDNNGCGYFEWLDDKVAAVNEKIALVNALNDRIALVSIVQHLENKVEKLQSENHDLQSTLTQAMKNPIGTADVEGESSSNTCEYNVHSEIDALKKRVAMLENEVCRSK
ncbi:hypothetical protein LINPERPRIM_LOCUS12414 [Linum perenne]